MTSATERILEQALALPEEDREVLVGALYESLQLREELSDEWRREISSRIEQVERGEVDLVPWDEVEARIRRTLGRK